MASAHGERVAAVSNANTIGTNFGNMASILNGQYDKSLSDLGQGYDTAQADVQKGISGLQPWLTTGGNALGMLGNAYGLNGASGNTAAQGAFQASPGYQYSVDQATQNAMRSQSAAGQLGSGNTTQAVTTLAQNLANQDYNQWLGGLSGLSQQGQGAANSTLGGYEQLGNLAAAEGTGKSNLDTGLGHDATSLAEWATNGMTGQATQAGQATDSAKNANQNMMMGIAGMPLQLLGMQMPGSVSSTGQAVSGGTAGGNMLSSLGKFIGGFGGGSAAAGAGAVL